MGLFGGCVLTLGILTTLHLNRAQSEILSLRTSPPSTTVGLNESLTAIGYNLQAATTLTANPVWILASTVPFLGEQLHAVSVVSSALLEAVTNGIHPAANAMIAELPELMPHNGRLNLDAITQTQRPLEAATRALKHARDQLNTIKTTDLAPPLIGPIRRAQRSLETFADDVSNVTEVARILPTALGRTEPRTYLLLFQNNAEWRSLGGVASSLAAVEADNGTLRVVSQANSHTMPVLTNPVRALDPEQTAIFGTQPTRWIQNVTQLPEFSEAAQTAVAMWSRTHPQRIDGVIAVDPVALSYLLRATGPVSLPGGDQITAHNAVSVLLNTVYKRYPNTAEKDTYFAEAALAVFQRLTAGHTNGRVLVQAFLKAGAEHRLLMWSPGRAEQTLINDSGLSGALPSQHDRVCFGVYLNDATGSKMDYYQSATTTAAWAGNQPGVASLLVYIRSHAPANAANLPRYITGGGAFGVPPGTTHTLVYVYLPPGTWLTADFSTARLVSTNTLMGGTVLSYLVTLNPGQNATLRLRIVTPDAPNIAAQQTPTIDAN